MHRHAVALASVVVGQLKLSYSGRVNANVQCSNVVAIDCQVHRTVELQLALWIRKKDSICKLAFFGWKI